MVDYKVPTFQDSDVEMKITLVEKQHPEGPFGAKGIVSLNLRLQLPL